MPSTSTQPSTGFTSRTWPNSRTSRLRRGASARSRNRLEVRFPRRTGAPPALVASSRTSRSRRSANPFMGTSRRDFSLVDDRGEPLLVVEEGAAHRIALPVDVALAEDDLEEMRPPVRHAKHVGARVEIRPPHPPEALVEPLRVDRVDARPVGVEALRPRVERERVVPPQVLDVDDLE